ncbi:MAG: aminotransferase [Rhodospirillales bacterium]
MTVSPPPGNSLQARDIASVVHPYTHLKKHLTEGPMVVVRGEGVRVWDDSGKDYIEGMAGLWSASLGFDNSRLVDAAVRQMKQLPFYHAFAGKSHEPLIELSEMLLARAPVPMARVLFANSGSEANDSAMKLVWYYNNALGRPNKKKIISRIKGYHGVTIASASLTGLVNNHRDFDLPIANVLHTDCPHLYRFGAAGESEEDFATRLAASLEKMIAEQGPETVAAFIAEPVMGAGGVIVPPKTYFPKIQAVLNKYDVLMIADEVICGFGRTGNYWGSQTLEIKPDIITCAKALSASFLPISGILIGDKVWQAMLMESEKIGVFGHGFTYSGHPVPAAVAVEALKIYDEIDLVGHVRAVTPTLQGGLKKFADHPLVGEVRGIGLLGALELVQNKKTKEPFAATAGAGAAVARHAQAHGAIVRNMGDVVAFSPPQIISKSEIEELLARTNLALDGALADLKAQGIAIG